jgi:hypothetical protein
MRLLHINQIDGDNQLRLVEFSGQDIPPYAILSHTWGPDSEEVTYHDVTEKTGQNKTGYGKIRLCGIHAARDGLQYLWVDTCCIDKSSSAELTESINSMFEWYKAAVVCYVTLADLDPNGVVATELPRCRWFTRGWTLQELLAPEHIRFYDRIWNCIGTKATLACHLSNITGISINVLMHGQLPLASAATKMSWAAQRETKRVEDKAYSMLGIFDVNMPLIYGEGMKAFRRLQEEIIKRDNDLTLFAWDTPDGMPQGLLSPLASSPGAFAKSGAITRYTDDFAEFSVTNKGLLISGDIPLRTAVVVGGASSGDTSILYLVCLGRGTTYDGGILLRKIGPKLFCRDGRHPLAGFSTLILQERMYEVSETYILLDTSYAVKAALAYRNQAIHIPVGTTFELRYTYPETLWDDTHRLFLRPKHYDWFHHPMVLVMKFNATINGEVVSLAVLCHHLSCGPVLKIFSQGQYEQEFEVISQARYRQDGIHVQELDLQARSIRAMTNSTRVKVGSQYHQISVLLCPSTMHTFAGLVETQTLLFRIDGNST